MGNVIEVDNVKIYMNGEEIGIVTSASLEIVKYIETPDIQISILGIPIMYLHNIILKGDDSEEYSVETKYVRTFEAFDFDVDMEHG
jgi:hypothetical protein